MVPVTEFESVEQPLSMLLKSDAVDVGAVTVTVVVPPDAVADASWASASLARLVATPVPAASPITAADKMAIIADNVKIRNEHPQTRLLLTSRGSRIVVP
jgi:hypothetical protein